MTDVLITISGVALGTAIWLMILRRYDRIEPEAIRHLLLVGFVGGFVSVLAAALVNEAARVTLGIGPDLFTNAFYIEVGRLFTFCLFIGLIEETSKAVATVYTTRRLGDLNEPIDAMIYAMTVGLGFASFENVLYAARFGNEVLLARFLWPVPAHMAYAALWGYGLAKARFVYPNQSRAFVMAPAVLMAALLHAVANFLLFLQETVTAAISLAALAALAVLAHVRLRKLVAESPFLQPGECPTCRYLNLPQSDECLECGTALRETQMFITCPCGQARVAVHEETCPACGLPVAGDHLPLSADTVAHAPLSEGPGSDLYSPDRYGSDLYSPDRYGPEALPPERPIGRGPSREAG